MKVLGIIVEYNPFHNGHSYHLEKAKELCGADFVVCVMSGNFIQRGEPAVVNKWARTKMALLAGIDLVIELPVVYSMSSAEYFSYGAVKILDSLGIVDFLCFGSEHGSIRGLAKIAEVLSDEPVSYKNTLKRLISTGISYPSAREKAIIEHFSSDKIFSNTVNSIIRSSNNILGIEYLKALKKLDSKITPITIQRISNDYNSCELTGSISSATSIRNHLKDSVKNHSRLEEVENTLPESSLLIIRDEFKNGRGPVYAADFESIMLFALRKMSGQKLSSLTYVSEGLENRIKNAANASGTFDELVENIYTKRYTRTRIQRMLFNSLLGIGSEAFDKFNTFGGPQYIRILGFNHSCTKLLSEIKGKASLPVIMKAADWKNSCNPMYRRMFEIEALATDIYVLAYKNPTFKQSGQEFTQNIVMIK